MLYVVLCSFFIKVTLVLVVKQVWANIVVLSISCPIFTICWPIWKYLQNPLPKNWDGYNFPILQKYWEVIFRHFFVKISNENPIFNTVVISLEMLPLI